MLLVAGEDISISGGGISRNGGLNTHRLSAVGVAQWIKQLLFRSETSGTPSSPTTERDQNWVMRDSVWLGMGNMQRFAFEGEDG